MDDAELLATVKAAIAERDAKPRPRSHCGACGRVAETWDKGPCKIGYPGCPGMDNTGSHVLVWVPWP